MSKNKRRDFIKWSIASGLMINSSLSSLAEENHLEIDKNLLGINPEKYWQMVREKFHLTKDRVYFNTAGLGASSKVVTDALHDWTIKLETLSETGHEHNEQVHQIIAEFVNADIEELAIIQNATEGMNIAARSIPLEKGDEVIISTHEHVGGAAPWLMLQNEIGIKVRLIDLNLDGKGNFDLIKQNISKKTKVIAISHVTCTTGMVLAVRDIVEYCRLNNIYTCIDGAQAVGNIAVDLKSIDPDFYIMSGHKWIHGPKGMGMLFINKKSIKAFKGIFAGAYTTGIYNLNRLEFSFKQSANRVEYGTRNAPQIIALGEAIQFLDTIGFERILSRTKDLAKQLKTELLKDDNVEILSPIEDEFSSSIVTFKLKNIDYLNVQEKLQLTHGFRVRGIYENELNAVRISCAMYNDKNEIEALVAAIKFIGNENDY